MEQLINKLKAELLKTLPGEAAQYQMAPIGRIKYDPSAQHISTYRSSAVMVLFCLDHNNNWFVPLTQRFSYGGAHSGQVSLPGGKAETTDLSLEDTAKRECFEEIGIEDEIEIVGALTQLHIPISGYVVAPIVGICKIKAPIFVASEREVKAIIRLNITDLLNNSILRNGSIEIEGTENITLQAPYFDVETYKIWGATAMILNELKEVIRTIF